MKKNIKKMVSFILAISLCLSMCTTAFSAGSEGKRVQDGSFEILELDDALFYLYQDDSIVYCSQITEGNQVQFSYGFKGGDIIYESGLLNLSDFLSEINNASIVQSRAGLSHEEINTMIINNLGAFQGLDEISLKPQNQGEILLSAQATPDISAQLNATFGTDFHGRLIGGTYETYNDNRYAIYCYGGQTTSELKYAAYEFVAMQAVNSIITWLLLGGFSCTIGWFIGAAQAVITTVNGIQYLRDAIQGNLYIYQCDRTRYVNVYGYENTLYWAGWTLKNEFLYNGSTWDVNKVWDRKDSDYEDINGLMAKGFSNYINYHL